MQSVCSLEARSRWAVTGTPIQNRLTDLATLFQFLRIHPFDQPLTFEAEFVRPWKSGSGPSAVAKLKMLVRFITIRRSKDILQLPPREHHIRYLDFTGREREMYESVRGQTRETLKDVCSGTHNAKLNHFNVLSWVNNLRLSCNDCSVHTGDSRSFLTNSSSDSLGDGEVFDISPVEETEIEPAESLAGIDFFATISEDLRTDSLEYYQHYSPHPRYHAAASQLIQPTAHSPTLLFPPRLDRISGTQTPGSSYVGTPDRSLAGTPILFLPTKIQSLVNDLVNDDPSAKRCVVCPGSGGVANLLQRCLFVLDVYPGSYPTSLNCC
jgi:hypothetical protein